MGMTKTLTKEEKMALCGVEVTLDGRPAAITGYGLPFATVATLPQGPAYEFAWTTVANVVANGGRFSS